MLADAYGPGLWFLWVVLVWGFVAFFFWRRRRWWRDPSTWGEAVLCARYARGEITEEEYGSDSGFSRRTAVRGGRGDVRGAPRKMPTRLQRLFWGLAVNGAALVAWAAEASDRQRVKMSRVSRNGAPRSSAVY